jgi:FAD binding domain
VVRGGGHHACGFCLAEGGVVIDTRALRGLRFDPATATVTAGAGCTWREIDQVTYVEVTVDGEAGPNHVAGLIVTTDSWVNSQVVTARFQGFGDGFEFWNATFPSSPSGAPQAPVTFEFVIFCDDLGGVDSVPRIWNTNGGTVFQEHVA